MCDPSLLPTPYFYSYRICTYFELPRCASSTISILPVVQTEHKWVFFYAQCTGTSACASCRKGSYSSLKVLFPEAPTECAHKIANMPQTVSVCLHRYLVTFNMEETSHAIREVEILLLYLGGGRLSVIGKLAMA